MARTFDAPIITNDQSIDRVMGAGLPIVFVFFNGHPTEGFVQTMDTLARQYAGRLLVVQIQASENPNAASKYQVKATPAVVTVKNGQVQSKAEGISSADIEKHAKYLLGEGPRPEERQAAAGRQQTWTGATTASSGWAQPGSGGPQAVTDATFDAQVLHASLPVLVDFWAPWCGPCRMTEPIVEKLAKEMSGRLSVAKMNVDENPATAQRYNIRSIPTMMIVKNGKIVDQWVGAVPEGAVRSKLAPHL